MAELRARSRLHPDVEAKIAEMTLAGYTPAQIGAAIRADRKLRSHEPSEKTIQKRHRFYRLEDPSEPWTLAAADPADAPFVLDAIAAVLADTGARPRVTVELARWIVRVRRARPDLVPAPGPDGTPAPTWRSRVVAAYEFAGRYLRHVSKSLPTDALDEELATFGRVERVRVSRIGPPGARIVGGRRDRALEERMLESMQRRTGAPKKEDHGGKTR